VSEAPHEPAGGMESPASQESSTAGTESSAPAEAAGPIKTRGRKRAAARRWTKRATVVIAAVLASLVVTFFSVDIGNISIAGGSLKSVAEREGSKWLKRPLHIARIKALVTPGKFAFEDVVIEGPTKDDRPFFSAKRITVDIPWWKLFRRELYLEIRLFEWRMVVENWATGGARLPNLKRQGGGEGPKITTRTFAVYANAGEFIFDDHVSNWSIVARNLNFALVRANNLNTYVGTARFSDGTTRIQDFLPMRTDFTTRFQLQGSRVRLHHIDLLTDGSNSHVNGYVNFANWPEQEYNVSSEVDFARMREIFFAKDDWGVSGEGTFTGIFRFSKTGRELAGQFASEEAGLSLGKSEWRFPHLHGALVWTANRFDVTHADSDFLGGSMRLTYGIPLGMPTGAITRFAADYQDLDLYRFTRQFGWTALEPQGRMRGTVSMAWPNGRFRDGMQGTGETVITPPAGESVASATLPPAAEPIPAEPDFVKYRPFGFFALAADTKYQFSASSLDFEPGWVATPKTYVTFSGHARGGPVNVPFHVTSHDWQNSDRLFAAIMTNFSTQMGAIEVGGRGTFDGVMTKAFNAPRIEGRFAGDQMRAWGVQWGGATGDIAIEDNYMHLANGRISYPGGGQVLTSGRYSLGYPRADGGEEINADVRVENMSLEPLKQAFQLVDWPVKGAIEIADMHLQGQYIQPGDGGKPGTMRLVNGTAWDEPFEAVTSTLVFEGNGSLRLRGMRMEKAGGHITGDAWVSWEENRYSFLAETEGSGIPVDQLPLFRLERAPLTGQLTFKASGDGNFDSPEWIVSGRIADLYAGGEGVGVVVGRLALANQVLRITVNADSVNRLQITGGGEIAMNDANDATLHFRVTETSVDPYLKFFASEMPYSKAIASGTVSVTGPLADPAGLTVSATIEKANLTLFAYPLENDGDIVLTLKDKVFNLERVAFKGDQTQLSLSGIVNSDTQTADVRATGQANLAVLQAFYSELSADGTANLTATLKGEFDDLVLEGQANIINGRLRHPALPHGFSAINGQIVMREGRISVDELRAVMGEGPVTFAGAIVLDGYRPSEYNLEAHGRSMQLRVPEGLRSTVNADLFLRGPITAPVLSGSVDVLRASYVLRVQPETGYLNLLGGGETPAGPDLAPEVESAYPMRLDIRVRSNVIPFVENNAGTIFGKADVDISGTVDRPIVTGRLELERGEWVFSGYRYRLQPGGSIDFSNPLQFEPYFDVAATTQVRTTGQTYDVTIEFRGSIGKNSEFSVVSEPWLPEFQVISMLLGESPDVGAAELRARSAPHEIQAQALRTAGAVFLASPITATVGSVAERVTGIDTVQIVPLLGNEAGLQQLNPTARVTLGTRISSRIYLTYSRTLTNTSDRENEIILIEFDQNDQLSWILSRNANRSFALDFRIKYIVR